MKTKIVAFESANSFVKVYSEGKGYTYPNTVSRAAIERFAALNGEHSENTVYEYEGKAYNVGQTIDYDTSSMSDISRYSSDEYRRESVFAIAHVAKDKDYIKAVTGIPSVHYSAKDQATKMINENLKGEHTVIVNGSEVSFTIKEVVVTLQPLASFFYSVIDENGNSNSEMIARYRDTETLIVDIGWGTTDLANCLSNGLKDYSQISISMKKAYEDIEKMIKAKFKDRSIVSANFQLLELEKQLRKSPIIKYANEHYDCADILESVFEDTTKRIITQVNNKRNISEYNTVLFTGGGSMALRNYLLKLLENPKTGRLHENIFIYGDSQTANVKGYYVYGKYILG